MIVFGIGLALLYCAFRFWCWALEPGYADEHQRGVDAAVAFCARKPSASEVAMWLAALETFWFHRSPGFVNGVKSVLAGYMVDLTEKK